MDMIISIVAIVGIAGIIGLFSWICTLDPCWNHCDRLVIFHRAPQWALIFKPALQCLEASSQIQALHDSSGRPARDFGAQVRIYSTWMQVKMDELRTLAFDETPYLKWS